MLFLKHPAWLWLKKFEKHRLPEIDENTQAMFDAGHEFEMYAEQLYQDGVKLGFDNFSKYGSLTHRTKDAVDGGAKTIFQGRFEANDLTCIIDILDNVSDGVWDLIEIKSSTRAKPEHNYDLAFQVKVLEDSGFSVRNISVIHINKTYQRNGDIDPKGITEITNVTESVRELKDITEKQITKAKQLLENHNIPDLSPRWANQIGVSSTSWFQEWLDTYKHIHPELDPYSIYYLSYPNAKQIGELEDTGIKLIKDIPENNDYREKHQIQIKTTKNDKRTINKDKIKAFLDTFTYPLYFFDYETYSSLIPIFDNESPYVDYPFQYSFHILDAPDGDVRHTEYIHQENSVSIPPLVEKL